MKHAFTTGTHPDSGSRSAGPGETESQRNPAGSGASFRRYCHLFRTSGKRQVILTLHLNAFCLAEGAVPPNGLHKCLGLHTVHSPGLHGFQVHWNAPAPHYFDMFLEESRKQLHTEGSKTGKGETSQGRKVADISFPGRIQNIPSHSFIHSFIFVYYAPTMCQALL